MEYALKYQPHLKGLVISNMMSSVPAYNEYAHKMLMPAMDPKALAEILHLEAVQDTENPRYMELLLPNFYPQHVLRLSAEEWPDSVNRSLGKINRKLYVRMQGPSEMDISGNATLAGWDRSADLHRIKVPALVIGAQYDTMDPAHMKWMSQQLPEGRYLYCPNGSHLALYDDQKAWFSGLIDFLKTVDARSSATPTRGR